MSSHRRYAALRPSLLLGALLLALTAPAHAATITVGEAPTGVGQVSPGTAGEAPCSLIGAIANANANNNAGDPNCAAGSGDDTIELPSGATFTLVSANSAPEGGTGLPDITSNITINGNGSTITRSAAGGTPNFRILRMLAGALTLNRVTLSNGKLTASGASGAGILNAAGGNLTLNQSTLSGNVASAANGGAVSFISSNATLTINNSTISNNIANGSSTNGLVYGGGGLQIENGTAFISNSTISGNMTNSADADGGAGMIIYEATVTITNSTITGNNSASQAGGIFSCNDTKALTIRNSIVAGNTATTAPNEIANNCGSTITANANNLFGHIGESDAQAFYTFTPGANDKKATSNGLNKALSSILNTTLANNGGPTQTHALVSGSPAIDASGANATTTDQRGYLLASGDTVRDIGAYEFNGVDPKPTVTSLSPTTGPAAGGTTVTVTGTNFIAGSTSVKFGTTTIAAANVTVNSATSLTVSSPSGTGTVDVTVTTASGTSATSAADQFTYQTNADGVCSTSVAASASAPSAGLCTSGTATAVSSTDGSWKWGCNGIGNGNGTAANACASPYQTRSITNFSASPTSIQIGASSTLSASSTSGAAPSFSTESPACSVSGNSATGVAAGTCTVAAKVARDADGCTSCFQAAQSTLDLTVTKKDQTITFGAIPLNVVVGGSDGVVSANAPGGTVTFSAPQQNNCSVTSAGVVTGIHAGTNNCTITATQAGNDTYSAATAPQTFSVGKGTPGSITNFTASPGSLTYSGIYAGPGSTPTAALSATASSSSSIKVINYTGTSGICGIDSNAAYALSPGTCKVTATQPGDNDYTDAVATLDIIISKGTQVISDLAANPTSLTVGGGNATLSVSGSGASGNAVVYGTTSPSTICTVSGNTVTPVGAGTCTVTADQAGNTNYNAADQQTLNIAINKASQTLSGFSANPASLGFGASATLSVTSSDASGNAVTYSSDTTSLCTVSGSSVSAVAVGTCTVRAKQLGNDNYADADEVTLAIVISAVAPSAPTGLVATAGNRRATLSFTPGSNGGAAITGYEYSLNEGAWMTAQGPAASPIQIDGLTNGTAYSIQLRALNSVGSGAASDVVTVTPRASGGGGGGGGGSLPTPPTGAPASPSASAGDGQVTVSFQPVDGATNYQYSTDGGTTFVSFDPPVTTSPATIPGLSNGTLYSIVLRALNSGGTGPSSTPVTVMPLADNDSDGLSSNVEDAVPSVGNGNGDGNGDGTPDSQQNYVASVPDTNGAYLTLASASAQPLSRVVPVAKPSDFPTDAGSLLSGVAFTVSGLDIGGVTTLELYVPSSQGTVTGLRKKNLRTGIWDVIPATISTVGSKTKIVYSLTDGGDYDSDGSANGSLSDPVFVVGTPATNSSGGGGGGSFGWLTLIPLMAAARRRRKH